VKVISAQVIVGIFLLFKISKEINLPTVDMKLGLFHNDVVIVVIRLRSVASLLPLSDFALLF